MTVRAHPLFFSRLDREFEMPRYTTKTFASSVQSPRLARRFVQDHMHVMCVPDVVQDAAVLVVTELVTNAVKHGLEGPIRVDLAYAGPHVTVSVLNPGHPLSDLAARRPDDTAASGRGLAIVDELATRWGWRRTTAGGTEVWAELPLSPLRMEVAG